MKQLNQSTIRRACAAVQNFTGPNDPKSGRNLRLNFHNAPLLTVLDYLSDAAGFTIDVKSNVMVYERLDIWSNRPLNDDDALNLLGQALHKRGCTVIQIGRKLAIMRTEDAKKSYIPLRLPARDSQSILN